MERSLQEMLAVEAVQAEERADSEERGALPAMPGARVGRASSDAGQVYSVRIPTDRLEELRQVAADLGRPPTVLLRDWILAQLDTAKAAALKDSDHAAEGVVRHLGNESLAPGQYRLGRSRGTVPGETEVTRSRVARRA